jgi:exosome complex exonuclease DIS3/RRP44
MSLYVSDLASVQDKRIRVALSSWTLDRPQARIVEIMGDVDDTKVEGDVILHENDAITKPFTNRALSCLPGEDWEMPAEEVMKRADFTGYPIASVDPPGCRDIDDALHARVLENGNIEVGVHIADVTYFLKAGCALDKEAARRSNTIYLVDRRTDMLPKILTEVLCSLVGGTRRFAFSVLWEMKPDTFEIVDTSYMKSVIQSKAAMTYEQAWKTIESDE